jgi:hypothetical protein
MPFIALESPSSTKGTPLQKRTLFAFLERGRG